MRENKIRERIQEMTRNAKTQIDIDRLVSQGAFKKLREEFPNADPSEIMYEWDSAKLRIKKMTQEG